eukprot:219941-Prorocentrum_minimum.AAC.1
MSRASRQRGVGERDIRSVPTMSLLVEASEGSDESAAVGTFGEKDAPPDRCVTSLNINTHPLKLRPAET